tara:strand:- start:518 stop:637 length:120 start_codon:yes stop_codon:yes gene_type:complete
MEEIFKNSKRIHDDFYLNENLTRNGLEIISTPYLIECKK